MSRSRLELVAPHSSHLASSKKIRRPPLRWGPWPISTTWTWTSRSLRSSRPHRTQSSLQPKLISHKLKKSPRRSAHAPRVSARRCTVSVSGVVKHVTLRSVSARTVIMMNLRLPLRLAKPSWRCWRNHTKGRHATVGRITVSRTIAFAISKACSATPSSAHARTVSTYLEHQNYPLLFRRKPLSARLLKRLPRPPKSEQTAELVHSHFQQKYSFVTKNLSVGDEVVWCLITNECTKM